jgi:hypothetical protein
MGFMLPMMGMSLLSNLLGRKDGGSIPPSNAKMRMRPAVVRPAAKKKGGAVKKRKSKPKK